MVTNLVWERINTELREYLNKVSKLGLLVSVIVAVGQEEAFCINVLKNDIDLSANSPSEYDDLTEFGEVLCTELADLVSLEISYITATGLGAVVAKLQERQSTIETIVI